MQLDNLIELISQNRQFKNKVITKEQLTRLIKQQIDNQLTDEIDFSKPNDQYQFKYIIDNKMKRIHKEIVIPFFKKLVRYNIVSEQIKSQIVHGQKTISISLDSNKYTDAVEAAANLLFSRYNLRDFNFVELS